MPNQDPILVQELLSHQAFLRRLAKGLVGGDADDLVQDVWQQALERPPQHGHQLRGWLARITRNLAANRWRADARRAEREERRAGEQPAGAEIEARLELRKELVSALDVLSKPYRETILLRYFEGLAPRAIASRQGIPVATVKTRLQRGLAQLRHALDKGYGGKRESWMPAVAALGAPVPSAAASGALMLGGITMGTMMKGSAAALVVAVCVYFVARDPRTEMLGNETVEPLGRDAEFMAGGSVSQPALVAKGDAEEGGTGRESGRRSLVVEESELEALAVSEGNFLRVILEGLAEEEAAFATLTWMGLDERDSRVEPIGDPVPCQGLSSLFELDPLVSLLERHGNLRKDEFEVAVWHPEHLGERVRVSLASGEELENGTTVYEVRVKLVRTVYWPEFTLAVRDARTRAHLEDVEIRFEPGVGAASWGRNGMRSLLGSGLVSPITLMGGRQSGSAVVAGLALAPAAGELPRLVELTRRVGPERGVIVSARAPGYAWGAISLDVSKGKRELLLELSAGLSVRLTNVQPERYEALGTQAMLCVYRIRADGGTQYVHFERVDETFDGQRTFRLENLDPGPYRVAVELGGGSWAEQPVLAYEDLSGASELVVGETRHLALRLDDPPAAPKRASLGGVVSFPTPTATWGEEHARLQLYFQPTQSWRKPDVELPLADLQRVGGALPSWSFRVEDLPVGRYRVQLLPFLKVWMIDLQPGGREDLELVLPELAEVLVETVDERTGERVPRAELYYRHLDLVPGQEQKDLAKAETEEPGRFRFWSVPGNVRVWPKWPNGSEREFGGNGKDVELSPGFQSVTFELEPVYALRFEFREDGTVLPTGPQGLHTKRDIRAVDHEGQVTGGGLQRDMQVEVSAPGLYEIRFDGLDTDRYVPLAPRLVDVQAGEPTEVLVELRRR